MFHLDPLGHLEVEGMVKYMSNTDILRDDHQKHLRYLKMTHLFWILFQIHLLDFVAHFLSGSPTSGRMASLSMEKRADAQIKMW